MWQEEQLHVVWTDSKEPLEVEKEREKVDMLFYHRDKCWHYTGKILLFCGCANLHNSTNPKLKTG